MNQIHFSIITPTYNRAYCLWKAIQSIIQQTYPFFEIIVIDDCSTDDTEKMINEFHDPRIVYIKNKENYGASKCRNIGIKKAKYNYIAYLDSDNSWHSDFLETYVTSITKNKNKKVFYSKKNYRLHIVNDDKSITTLRDEDSNTENYFDLRRLFHRKIIIDTNALVHEKEIVRELSGWDENLDFWEDWELSLRIAEKHGNVFQPINRVLLNYEQTLDFTDKEKTVQRWENAEKYIYEKYANNPNLEGQKWFPPDKAQKSTLSIVEFLKNKKG